MFLIDKAIPDAEWSSLNKNELITVDTWTWSVLGFDLQCWVTCYSRQIMSGFEGTNGELHEGGFVYKSMGSDGSWCYTQNQDWVVPCCM